MYDSFLSTMRDKGHTGTQDDGDGESLITNQVVEHNYVT